VLLRLKYGVGYFFSFRHSMKAATPSTSRTIGLDDDDDDEAVPPEPPVDDVLNVVAGEPSSGFSGSTLSARS
jgi:hypothetical protein